MKTFLVFALICVVVIGINVVSAGLLVSRTPSRISDDAGFIPSANALNVNTPNRYCFMALDGGSQKCFDSYKKVWDKISE